MYGVIEALDVTCYTGKRRSEQKVAFGGVVVRQYSRIDMPDRVAMAIRVHVGQGIPYRVRASTGIDSGFRSKCVSEGGDDAVTIVPKGNGELTTSRI
jgi:hypothetical protein